METLGQGDMETWRHGDMETRGHGYTGTWGHKDMETSNRKQKSKGFSLSCLPFVHHANGSLSFVCLLTNKQTKIICLQTD
jgi:hypothetical protein